MNTTFLSFLTVGIGGAVGAMSRYGLTLAAAQKPSGLALGTLMANLLGCLLMGVLVQLLVPSNGFGDESLLSDQHRLLFGVGFCGAFTTLSSFVFEISQMVQRSELSLAFAYLMATLIGGFAFFYVGALVVRWIMQSQSG